jgi:ubiquinone/menaquinone biosynthesis C-methylase UbiE
MACSAVGILLVILAGSTRLNSALVKVDIFLRKVESFFILSRVERVPEEDEVVDYCGSLEAAMRWIRDKGWFQAVFPVFLTTTQMLVAAGIKGGQTLELGPGSGYLGLEWLKSTADADALVGLDVSSDMVRMANQNAEEYGLAESVKYFLGDGCSMPFGDEQFDCVFSNASLHEWENPREILNEISRVLKPGGRFYISDLRRDVSDFIRWFVWLMTKPATVRPYLTASVRAAYTTDEVEDILRSTQLRGWQVSKTWYGLVVSG